MYLAAATATLSFITALSIKYKSIKDKNSRKADMKIKDEKSKDIFSDNGNSSYRFDNDEGKKN